MNLNQPNNDRITPLRMIVWLVVGTFIVGIAIQFSFDPICQEGSKFNGTSYFWGFVLMLLFLSFAYLHDRRS